jgi:hypothetical protein
MKILVIDTLDGKEPIEIAVSTEEELQRIDDYIQEAKVLFMSVDD